MNENYSDEVKSIIEAAQQQALMNYNQEVTSAHLLLALCSDDFFRFLLQTFKVDENTFKYICRRGPCNCQPYSVRKRTGPAAAHELGLCPGQRNRSPQSGAG